MLKRFWLKHPSTYVAFAIWGASAFMAQPTLASLFMHLGINAPLLFLVVWCAHHEGSLAGFQEGFVKGQKAKHD